MPDTSYTITANATYVVNEKNYTKDFLYKTFVTSTIGAELTKDSYTNNSLAFNVNFSDKLIDSADVVLLDGNGNEIANRKQTVKNNGTVPAKLTGFNLYNKGTTTAFSNNDIEILIQNLDTTGNEVLQSGESTTITFTVKWKKDSTAKSATAEFDIELDYEQATEEFTGTASDVNTKN